ncbi:MAG: hypothetical protein U9N35_07395 [Euryarchaeota archaeon]|nr:hypothetical protein [Euryarchaeota archaeon]
MKKVLFLFLIIFLTGCTVMEFSISSVRVCRSIKDGEPVGEDTEFSNAGEIYCWLSYDHAPEKTVIKAIWYYEDEKMYEKKAELQSSSGSLWFSISSTEKHLPAGNYRVDIYANDQLKEKKEFSITR